MKGVSKQQFYVWDVICCEPVVVVDVCEGGERGEVNGGGGVYTA